MKLKKYMPKNWGALPFVSVRDRTRLIRAFIQDQELHLFFWGAGETFKLPPE
jgi:hypothetical protein